MISAEAIVAWLTTMTGVDPAYPYGECGSPSAGDILNVVARNAVIGIDYIVISAALTMMYLRINRVSPQRISMAMLGSITVQGLTATLHNSRLFWTFGLFILLCGFTHLAHIADLFGMSDIVNNILHWATAGVSTTAAAEVVVAYRRFRRWLG